MLARAFGELGYRRSTTAELARRCGVRENILYRHWPDKAAMFVAALDYVGDLSIGTWRRVLEGAASPDTAATELLAYEARHLGEFGNYRILFSALGDTDTPEIRRALRRVYRSFHRLIRDTLIGKGTRARAAGADADHAAWAVIGLGTIATILGEIGLLSAAQREILIRRVGAAVIEALSGESA